MTQSPTYPRRPPSIDQLVTSDGEPMETARHFQQMSLLIDSLEFGWQDRDDFYVGGNMFLYFCETQSRRNDFRGPDVFVVTNTTRRERRAWVVWEEDGQAPDVIIELLSDTTEHIDRGEKMRIYSRVLRVAEYFLFDPFSKVLEGYELDPLHASYVRKPTDDLGRLRCERLGLHLATVRGKLHGVETEWLRWLDADGNVLPTSFEAAVVAVSRADAETERANAATERANAATERANAEAERADRLAAELAALKGR
jgi:Uma2 family endonuclease